jgi:epoxyqueuosine reductase
MGNINIIVKEAKELGFLAVGFCRAKRAPFYDQFRDWIDAGKQGQMGWLEKHIDLRESPSKLLDDCQTVITLAHGYSPRKPSTPDGLSVARYVEPGKRDYHDRLRDKIKGLVRIIQDKYPGHKARICVDSAPILERSFAYASGIGFIGRNNMLVIPGYGSYLILAEILTTVPFPISPVKPMGNQCGSCERCLEACPTGALEGPFSLNASKCLSYQTVEYDGALEYGTGEKMGNCFFGCDVCQEVCPFNEGMGLTDISLPPSDEIIEMGPEVFNNRFSHTAFQRAGLDRIKRNVRAIKG